MRDFLPDIERSLRKLEHALYGEQTASRIVGSARFPFLHVSVYCTDPRSSARANLREMVAGTQLERCVKFSPENSREEHPDVEGEIERAIMNDLAVNVNRTLKLDPPRPFNVTFSGAAQVGRLCSAGCSRGDVMATLLRQRGLSCNYRETLSSAHGLGLKSERSVHTSLAKAVSAAAAVEVRRSTRLPSVSQAVYVDHRVVPITPGSKSFSLRRLVSPSSRSFPSSPFAVKRRSPAMSNSRVVNDMPPLFWTRGFGGSSAILPETDGFDEQKAVLRASDAERLPA